MLHALRDLLPLLGCRGDTDARQRFAALAGDAGETIDARPEQAWIRDDEDGDRAEARWVQYWIHRGLGLSLLVEEGRITSVFLEPVPPEGYSPFHGIIADGLSASSKRSEVRSVLGLPQRSGEPRPIVCDEGHEPHVIGMTRAFDRYEYPAYSLLFEYASPDHPPVSPDVDYPIKLVVLIDRAAQTAAERAH